MSSESTAAPAVEPTMKDETNFEGNAPQNSAYVKWDVKGGGDRTHEPNINTNYSLDGTPNIQGVEIKSTVPTKLLCWAGSPSGTPSITIDGPTNGKAKNDPRRIGSYRIELR